MALATGAIVTTLALAGCGSSESIVGTWANAEGDEVLQFESNGTCSVPFIYSAGWMESCDRYVMRDDGTLVLSSSQGNWVVTRFGNGSQLEWYRRSATGGTGCKLGWYR